MNPADNSLPATDDYMTLLPSFKVCARLLGCVTPPFFSRGCARLPVSTKQHHTHTPIHQTLTPPFTPPTNAGPRQHGQAVQGLPERHLRRRPAHGRRRRAVHVPYRGGAFSAWGLGFGGGFKTSRWRCRAALLAKTSTSKSTIYTNRKPKTKVPLGGQDVGQPPRRQPRLVHRGADQQPRRVRVRRQLRVVRVVLRCCLLVCRRLCCFLFLVAGSFLHSSPN
jgi:hypothetical protein